MLTFTALSGAAVASLARESRDSAATTIAIKTKADPPHAAGATARFLVFTAGKDAAMMGPNPPQLNRPSPSPRGGA
jgi:hypothetical protein